MDQLKSLSPCPTTAAFQPPPGKRVCLILRCWFHQDVSNALSGKSEYKIYIFDLDSEKIDYTPFISYTERYRCKDVVADAVYYYKHFDAKIDDIFNPIHPTLQIPCGTSNINIVDAFCMLDHTLYIFEGSCSRDGNDSRKSVFKIDLSDPTKKKEKIGHMFHSKQTPLAIPTPDRCKIVVFSSYAANVGFCELFDPVNLSFEEIPWIELENSIEHEEYTPVILAYGFINNSELLVQIHTMEGKIEKYVLDVDSTDKCWQLKSTVFEGVDCMPTSGDTVSRFDVVEERYWFGTFCGPYDLADKRDPFIFDPLDKLYLPCLNFSQSKKIHVDTCKTLLNYNWENRNCYFCDLQIERESRRSQSSSLIILSLSVIDLMNYEKVYQAEELLLKNSDDNFGVVASKLVSTRHHGAVRKRLDFGATPLKFSTCCFFSI